LIKFCGGLGQVLRQGEIGYRWISDFWPVILWYLLASLRSCLAWLPIHDAMAEVGQLLRCCRVCADVLSPYLWPLFNGCRPTYWLELLKVVTGQTSDPIVVGSLTSYSQITTPIGCLTSQLLNINELIAWISCDLYSDTDSSVDFGSLSHVFYYLLGDSTLLMFEISDWCF